MPENDLDPQYSQWTTAFGGDDFYYGYQPGPVARRAVRYHRPLMPQGGTALDAGCGEGQDLAFLAECGYAATGIEYTDAGLNKARRLLTERGLAAELVRGDLRSMELDRQFDLVLAINSLQFLGESASSAIDRIIAAVAPGGVLGLSLFAPPSPGPALRNGVLHIQLEELLARFDHRGPGRTWQMLETAQLGQWNQQTNEPRPFVTLVAQRLPGLMQIP